MAFDHRGFRVTVDVEPDESGMQWMCRAAIDGIDDTTRQAALPAVELAVARLKIDALMAISMVEHQARDTIDDWYRVKAPGA